MSDWLSQWQGHLLSCSRQLKNHYGDISGPAFVKIIVPDLTSFPLVMLRPWYSVLMLSGHMSQMLRVCFLSFWNSSWFPTIVNILLSFTVHHIYMNTTKLWRTLNAGCKLFEMNRYIYICQTICKVSKYYTILEVSQAVWPLQMCPWCIDACIHDVMHVSMMHKIFRFLENFQI